MDREDTIVYGGLGLAAVSVAVGTYFLVRRYFAVGAVEFQGRQYHFNDEDRLWMARMAYGEAGNNTEGAEAVLWAVASRWVTKPRFQSMSFTQLMRAFSTPVMVGCRSGSASYCHRISSLGWDEIPAGIRDTVDRFMAGRVRNPVPGYNNFAADWALSQSARANSELPAVNVGGNIFLRDPGSLTGRVRIV